MSPGGAPCRHIKILLGVYVLGGLRGHQETQVSEHLARCAQCRAEYQELAEVPALLDMITGEEAARTQSLPDQAAALEGAAEPAAPEAAAPDAGAGVPGLLPLRRPPACG
jgi:predicted anti-sigma-YlaC factor YlaD